VANGPELEFEFRKIYTDRTSVLFCRAMPGKLLLLFGIPDASGETQGRSWAGHSKKMGNSRTGQSKMGKERTYDQLISTTGYESPWSTNGIQIVCLESRAEIPAFASEIDQVLEEGGVLQPSWGPKHVLANRKLQ
jgi:hypothetical protein